MRSLTFLVTLMVCCSAHAVEVQRVVGSTVAARARLVFETSGAVSYQIFTMNNPDRVVIDFKNARAGRAMDQPPNVASVKHMAVTRRADGTLRVVLDLRERCKVGAALLKPEGGVGYRVVLDLDAPSRSAAIAASVPARPPAVVAATLRPPHAPAAPRQRPGRALVVAIDAGHGGQDAGATGPTGVYEKDVVLAVARHLARLIDRRPDMRAVLTRDSDLYLPLRSRMERARAKRADLFISIHADAVTDRRVRGASVYVLSQRGATNEAAKWLADKENADDLGSGVSLDDKDHMLKSVLLDLSQNASLDASMDLANSVLRSLRAIGSVHRERVQQAGFVVLKSPDIPSILVETAYITNPTEEKRLRDDNYRQHLARAIFSGVVGYAEARRRAPAPLHLRMAGAGLPSALAADGDSAFDEIKLAAALDGHPLPTRSVAKIP